jgi:formamidopyrimidine-DNA glycosylase
MPELPEVETIVKDLQKKIIDRKIVNLWTDFPKIIKKPSKFEQFKKEIKSKKIKRIWRRAKNIIFDLNDNYSLLIHQKMTGHLLFGKWEARNGKWTSVIPGPLRDDQMNRFLHLIFTLDNGWQLALSDLRKFAKVELWETKELENDEEMKKLGPEPLAKDFTFEKFKKALRMKKAARGEPRQRRGKIKQVLMDQEVIAGIGNIYSDEILWKAKIHPFKDISKLSDNDFKKIYKAMREILPLAIKLGGESISNYRRPSGEKGFYDKAREVYRREGEKCPVCGGIIKRGKIGGRSAHFCPACQKL